MSYLVLARKYRPQSFLDLVGQNHVARTLANAITQGRVAHAFLFTGARGVGKTTSARLLAKCLNCLGANGEATGPVVEPCGTCAACVEITAGTDMDVQEIDGASYNGIDEVRRLQETMGFRPARDRNKIYIVDEVHMLSNAAWNAFLKTLEEPPPHVKFVFATTEIQKVPVTILSRCQRYDFRLVSVPEIAARLRDIAKQESIDADDGALRLVARQAAGSMRDALSLFDHVLAFAAGSIGERDVATVLGVADRAAVTRAATAVLNADPGAVLKELVEVLDGGADLTQYARDLLECFRDAVAAKISGAAELFELPPGELEALRTLVAPLSEADLARIFHGFSADFEKIVRSHAPRHTLEMSLVKLAVRPPLLPIDELLVRLRDLERRAAGAKGSPPGPPEPASTTVVFPVPAGESPREAGFVAPGPAPAPPPAPARPAYVAPKAAVELSPFAPPPMDDDGVVTRSEAPKRSNAPPVRASAAPPAVEFSRFDMPPEDRWGDSAGTAVTVKHPSSEFAAAPPARPTAPPRPQIQFGKELAPEDERTLRALIDLLRVDTPVLASAMENAWVAEVSAKRVVFAFPEGSFLGSGVDATAKAQLAAAIVTVLGENAALDVVSHMAPNDTAPSLSELDAERRRLEEIAARSAAEAHPLVQRAVEVLRARVRHVRLADKE